MSDKLPEWPEKPGTTELFDSYCHQQGMATAALARMEALVELVKDMHGGIGRSKDMKNWYERRDELLAACERRSGG